LVHHNHAPEVFLNYFGLLFDLDGTLVNSLPDICGVINRVRAAFSLAPLAETVLVKFIGRGVEELIHLSFPELTEEQRVGLIAKYREHYAQSPTMGGQVYPGVLETLTAFRQLPHVRLAICTNKATDIAKKTVEHYLPGFQFDFIAGPEMVSQRKPAPQHLTEVMARLELKPEHTWFVGDDKVDFESARAAKVNFLGAVYGFGGVQVEPAQRLEKFTDLLHRVKPLAEGIAL